MAVSAIWREKALYHEPVSGGCCQGGGRLPERVAVICVGCASAEL